MKNAMSKKVVAMVVLASIMGTTVTSAAEINKDESIFVNLQSDGTFEKATVSNWIHSDESNIEIKDKSELSDIKNVKTDDEPTKEGDNLLWNVSGSDIYYQGTTNKDLPLDIKIKYYLDDKEIEADDLAGKSGRVKIELEVINKDYNEVSINGKTRKIYTPFTTAAVVTLPVDKFSSVKTDSGIMLSEGNNNIVSFVAFPGLEESLGLDEIEDIDLDVNLSNKLTIEADVDDFELAPIMITATPKLPDLSELDKVDTVDELTDSLKQLKDGSDKLLDGTGQLKDGIELAQTKLIDGTKLLDNSDVKEKMSLITVDNNVSRANKLIDDAYFAKDLDTEKVKKALSLLTDDNILQANELIGDYRAIAMYKDLLNATINSATKLSKDQEFTKLINDAVVTKEKYEQIDAATRSKLQNLLGLATADNISKGQTLIKEGMSVKNDFAGVGQVVNGAIANAPGSSSGEKTVNFIKGLDNSLASASNLLNDSTLSQLKSLGGDMTGYASSYLVIKAQLAATFNGALQAGGQQAAVQAFNNKKTELSQMVSAVYGEQGAELKTYIDSLTLQDITPEKISADAQKIAGYKQTLPGLINGVDSLKGMKPLIDSTHSVLSQEGEAEKLAKLLGDLNDPTTKQLVESLGQAILSLNDSDLQAIGDMISSLNALSQDLETNKDNIAAIEQLINQIGGNQELVSTLTKFKGDLDKSQSLINEVQTAMGSMSASDINNLKNMSNELMSMQQDLKDSEDILRITRDLLSKGNVTKARNLIAALPTLEDGINQLAQGSKDLQEGMQTFHDDGIDKLYDEGTKATDSIKDVLAAKDELVKASEGFDTFTGKSDDMSGSVKFIMKTKEIKAEKKDDGAKKETKTEKKGFFQWLKSLFVKED